MRGDKTVGVKIPEVQLFTSGKSKHLRLLAHDDEALIEEFVRLLREALG